MEPVSAGAKLRLDDLRPMKAVLGTDTLSTPCMCYPLKVLAGLKPRPSDTGPPSDGTSSDSRHIVSAWVKQTVLTPAISCAETFSDRARVNRVQLKKIICGGLAQTESASMARSRSAIP